MFDGNKAFCLFHNLLARQLQMKSLPPGVLKYHPPTKPVEGTPSTSTAQTTDDDGSATLVHPNLFKKHKRDKLMVVDWMGSWWAGKSRRPSLVSSIDSNASSVMAAPPSEPTSSTLAIVKQPNQAKRRRTTKSVFGTPGISIINPTISTTPTPTTSVTVPISTALAVETSFTPPTTEEIPASTEQLLPPPPRQIASLFSHHHCYECHVRFLWHQPNSNKMASSAQKMTKKAMKKEALRVVVGTPVRSNPGGQPASRSSRADGSLVDFVPGPEQYAESVRSTSSWKRKLQGIAASGTSNSNSNSNRQAIAGGSSRTGFSFGYFCAVGHFRHATTRIHDERRAASQKAWDAFLKQRSSRAKPFGLQPRHVPSFTGRSATVANGSASLAAGGVAAILGMKITGGTRGSDEDEVEEALTHSEGLIGFAQLGLPASKEERKEFNRLVRNGIPLIYRAKVWLECSGGSAMKEPGLFQELSAVPHKVEKVQMVMMDREMWLEGFDCIQSEDAFWTHAAIVERILPEDFFSLVLLNYTLFRVWDIFVVDGLDVLFRVAFAILGRNEQELLRCESHFTSPLKTCQQADQILQLEAEFRNMLLHTDVVNRRDTHVEHLQQLTSISLCSLSCIISCNSSRPTWQHRARAQFVSITSYCHHLMNDLCKAFSNAGLVTVCTYIMVRNPRGFSTHPYVYFRWHVM
ncbi:hypothetical protein JOM56_000894 [Amanita muscaria]